MIADQIRQAALTPYRPSALAAELVIRRLSDPPPVLLPGAPPTYQIGVPANPRRVFLLVIAPLTGPSPTVVFSEFGFLGGINAAQGQNHVLLHAASYPGLIAGSMVVISNNPAFPLVVEGFN